MAGIYAARNPKAYSRGFDDTVKHGSTARCPFPHGSDEALAWTEGHSEVLSARKAGVPEARFKNSTPFTNVKKGDRVSVKGAKKYDALSPDTVPGTVLFIHPDGKVAVQVGSGQMNVLPQDIVNAYSNGIQRGSLVKIKTPYGKTITGEVVELTGGGIKVQDPVDKKQFYVVQESSVLDYTNSFQNGRQKAETYLNQKMAEAGVEVENIAIYVVEGEEFYGGTVFDAVAAWCKAHRKSEARVTAPGSVAGTYEMTAGGRAIKQ